MAQGTGAMAHEPRIAEVLGGLRMTVAQLRLYPKASAQVAKACSVALPPVLAFLEARRSLTLAAAPEGLLVNAVRFPTDDASSAALEVSTLVLLREAGLKSFTLRAGLTDEEFIKFLYALAIKFWDIRDGKKINLRLCADQVLHAVVDEVEYVELNKEDVLLKDAAAKLEAAGFDSADLLRTLEQRLELAVENGKGSEARTGLIRKVLEQDPTLLGHIVREGVATDRPGDTPGIITADQALDALRKLWKVMSTADAETRALLCGAAERILEPFAGKSAGVLALVLVAEMPELMPAWMMESVSEANLEYPAAARAREIIFLSPEARADALLREGKTLIKELSGLGRHDLIERLLGIAGERLDAPSTRQKTQAVEICRSLGETLESQPLTKAWEELRKKLSQALDKETEASIYAKLVELAGTLLEPRTHKHGSGGASELRDTLMRHSSGSDAPFPDRPAMARSVASKFQPSSPPVPVSASTAERVANSLQQTTMQFLIAQMKDMEDAPERLELAETMARIGPNAGALLCEELKKTKVPSQTIRLLEVLPWVATPDLAEPTLASLLAHPVVLVRRKAALVMVDRKYAGAEQTLLSAFDGKEVTTRAAVADALAKLGTEAALAKIRAGADSREQRDDVRCACCVALGHTSDPKALTLLANLATPPTRGITRVFRSVSPAVRLAATKALASFSGIPDVKDLLVKLETDADELVKAAAKEILRPRPNKLKDSTPPAPAEPEPAQEILGFSGLISEIPIHKICQVIGNSGKTGLLLANFEGPSAKIYFEKGLIVSADFEGKEDQEAFNLFIKCKEGAFVFKLGERTLERRMRAPVDQVLIAAFQA
jgi:hypothetical protein